VQFEREIDGPVAVIGDVHGQVDRLEVILRELRELPDYERRWIVFIGDLVDRGFDPKGAMDRLSELMDEHPRTTAICGNHELAMGGALGIFDTPDYTDWGGRWLDHYSSETTFASYDVPFGHLRDLAETLPETHRKMLQNLPWCVEHPQFFFVHAGLDPTLPFDLQRSILRERDFSLQRPQWLCSKECTRAQPPEDCEKVVVSGHMRVKEVMLTPRKVLCDTSGGFGGVLSCVLLPEGRVISAD